MLNAATLRKEFALRLRGPGPFLWFSAWLFLLALTCAGAYAVASADAVADSRTGWSFGRSMIEVLLYAQVWLTLAAAPGVLAGAIAAERDEGTLALLQIAPVRPVFLLFGKLLPGLAFLALLMLGTLPFAGICLTFGGISVEDVLGAYGGLAAVLFAYGALGLWASTAFPGTVTATIAVYALVTGMTAVGALEPTLVTGGAYGALRALVLVLLVLRIIWDRLSGLANEVVLGHSHTGCVGLLVALLLLGGILGTLSRARTAPMVSLLNPFSAVLPFVSREEWPGAPTGLSPSHAMVAAVLHLGLGMLAVYLASRRLGREFERFPRSDPRHVVS